MIAQIKAFNKDGSLYDYSYWLPIDQAVEGAKIIIASFPDKIVTMQIKKETKYDY